MAGKLNWESITGLFKEVLSQMQGTNPLTNDYTKPGMQEEGYLGRIKSAIHATMKLIACVQPHAQK